MNLKLKEFEIMINKLLSSTFLLAALVLSTFAQNEVSPLTFKGKFDFDIPSEQILAHRFLDNGTKLWMLGANTIQVWDVESKKVISSEKHGIPYLSDRTFGG